MLKKASLRKNSLTNQEQRSDEVLRVTLYSNTDFNEMWFLTVDPLVRISSQNFLRDKTAGVSSRTFIVKNIPNSLT